MQIYTRGGPKKDWNYLLEGGPLVVQTSPARWVFWESIYISWHCCERLHSASVNFCLLFQHICPFHDGWFMSALPMLRWVFSHFWSKVAWPPWATLTIHLISPGATLASPHEESLQKEMFCRCGRGETKNGRSTKKHQNQWVQKLFWAMEKNVSIDILHQMETTLKVTKI